MSRGAAGLVALIFLCLTALCEGSGMYTIHTGATMIVFNTTVPALEYYARDQDTQELSEDAFVVRFNNLTEVAPNGEIVQGVPVSGSSFSFTVSESRQPGPQSDILYDDAFEVTYNSTIGIKIIFLVFTKEQTIVEVETNKTTQVKQGSIKYSMIIDFWPFITDQNQLQLSSNITTLKKNSITECTTEQTENDAVSISCEAEGLIGSFDLLQRASTVNVFTREPSSVKADIVVLVCPIKAQNTQLPDDFKFPRDAVCSIPLLDQFPEGSSSSSSNSDSR
mmetsp:Transcript_16159/g.20679  ORF Transcript_16159/g.20679 Transcript_16159/m.20679 type:complete len:279 (-) Transcript_16159:646-1482(-)